ncbi:MAG: Ppx/GppA family phosphatase, partial [Chloroflexi bacterium]|nr:Ppx/GppA family phosphatase [Chloroflexota bacterium]
MENNAVKPSDNCIVAFLDIGTNSIRLLLVKIAHNHTYTILTDQKEVVRLGEGEFPDHLLQPEAMQRAVLVCRKFAETARSRGAQEIIAVATSATREAGNRAEFIGLLKKEAGIDVRTISGMEEARLIYLGVVSGLYLNRQTALFVDIGGGSTELIVGNQRQYDYLDSQQLGAIRLASMFMLPGEDGPVDAIRYEVLQNYVRNTIVRSVQHISSHPVDLVVGSSGTIENLAEIIARVKRGRKIERDDVFTYAELNAIIQYLRSLSMAERREVPGINPERADIIVPGAAIIDVIMQETGIQTLRISDRGLRDGLLMDYLAK